MGGLWKRKFKWPVNTLKSLSFTHNWRNANQNNNLDTISHLLHWRKWKTVIIIAILRKGNWCKLPGGHSGIICHDKIAFWPCKFHTFKLSDYTSKICLDVWIKMFIDVLFVMLEILEKTMSVGSGLVNYFVSYNGW